MRDPAGGVPLIDSLDPGHYVGIDVGDEAITHARRELRAAGLAGRGADLRVVPDLAVADLGTRFDVVWAFQVMIHMTDEIAARAARFIGRHLVDGGVAHLSVKIGPPRDRAWRGFPAVRRPLGFYERLFAGADLQMEDMGPLTGLGHVLPGRPPEAQADQRMVRVTRP